MADRQCPHCELVFGIHWKTYQTEHYLNLRCPYCEWVAEFDEFTTEKQIEYVKAVQENEGAQMMEDVLEDALGDFLEMDGLTSLNKPLPSPHVDAQLESKECGICDFKYRVLLERDICVCPVCRG